MSGTTLDNGFEFVNVVGSRYQCTICRTNHGQLLEPVTHSKMIAHLQRQTHKNRVEHELVRLLTKKQHEEELATHLSIPFVSANDESPLTLQVRSDVDVDVVSPVSEVFPLSPPPPPPDTLFPPPTYLDLQDSDILDPDLLPTPSFFDSQQASTSHTPSKKSGRLRDPDWAPFRDRAHCLTHSLFNDSHIHFSVEQQQAILDWANAMGTLGVPTLYSLDQCQETLKDTVGDASCTYQTPTGSIYYLNSINAVVQQDFSNRDVRERMEFYPEDAGNHSSEIWHGEKLVQGHNRQQLTPMVTQNGSTYFVDEVCELVDGSTFVPDMFLRREGGMWARGYHLTKDDVGPNPSCFTRCSERTLKPLLDFRRTCEELRSIHPNGINVRDADLNIVSCDQLLSNRLRAVAAGRPIYSVPFIVFVDDVSGNQIPREDFNRRKNIRFMCTSQHASPMEMLDGICSNFSDAFDNMVPVWDALEQCEVLARPYILFLPADNPMQAEECSSTGLRSNMLCRTCKVGGTQKYKLSDTGYSELFQATTFRTPSDTIQVIRQQYEIAFTATAEATLTSFQRDNGIKDSIAQPILERIVKRRQELQKMNRRMPMSQITEQLRTEFSSLSDCLSMNPLLTVEGLDIHIDTPTEILHTLLLGIAKYLWVEAVHAMDKSKQFELFCTRLRSLSVAGINSDRPIPNYICTNRGSLTGKHFKILVQVMSFCLYGLVPDTLRIAWASLSRLTVLAWYSIIDDLPAYITELECAIQVLLHDLAKCAPQLLIDKGKVHLLVHMPFFVRRFGPLLGPDTERYESFNSAFRECSIHSNRHAPSRDIAAKFAAFDRTRHVASGGCWLNRETGRWERAGAHVLALAQTNPFLLKILGGKDPAVKPPGSTVVLSKSPVMLWESTALSLFACPPGLNQHSPMRSAATFQTQCGDTASPGSHVVFRVSNSEVILGRVHEIWTPQSNSGPSCVILRKFSRVPDDVVLNMPAVQLQDESVLTTVANILGVINLQHRCAFVGCQDTGRVVVRQERQDTNITKKSIGHTDDTHFLINIHSMHNYKLTRDLLGGWFDLRAQLEAPNINAQIRNQAALQIRSQRQRKKTAEESTEEPAVAQNADAESSSAGRKRKRVVHASTNAQHSSAAETPGLSTSSQLPDLLHAGHVFNQPQTIDQGHRMYAPPVYPEGMFLRLALSFTVHILTSLQELPPGWRAIWSFNHGRFYFHHIQTGATTWDVPQPTFGMM
ncbi:hypothetical protein FRC12_019015 [Ceratobasidium sp. 428]|nr:hypothetical protein FRC12_019015 [Ceratobasidium sp. 428]